MLKIIIQGIQLFKVNYNHNSFFLVALGFELKISHLLGRQDLPLELPHQSS
jgi:hypothetical protein